MSRANWSTKDLIDLEYFLHLDENDPAARDMASPAERDRQIYLCAIQPREKGGGPLSPTRMIRLWLDERRRIGQGQNHGPMQPLPGEIYAETYRMALYGFLAAGVLSGAGLAFSLLNYRGTEPLNVSVYLAALVLSQWLALLILAGMRVIGRMRRSLSHGSVLFGLASGLLVRLLFRMREHGIERLTGSQRAGFEAVAGVIRGRRRVYKTAFYWPIFILFQIFGIGFNLGALVGTLIKVVGSDVAFGWQSTLQVSAQAVFRIAQIMAIPWSWWIPPGVAYPSLSEIQGSHMVLKDGIYHLATEDLVSWWPFLCLAVLTYGLVPRVALMVNGLVRQRRALARVELGHAACAGLLQRLTSPLVRTQGRPGDAKRDEAGKGEGLAALEKGRGDGRDAESPHRVIALVPDDIFDACQSDRLAQVVGAALGCRVGGRIRVGEGVDQDEAVLGRLRALGKGDDPGGLILVQEAWQPPIRETLRFIRDLRKVVGERTMMWVGLIGRPREGKVFTRPKGEEVRVWQQKLKALGDPYLGVEELAEHEP